MSGDSAVVRPPTIGGPETMIQLDERVWVIPDLHWTPHVPNVGIIVGDHAALIVDSGLGAPNADRVFAALRSVTDVPLVYLTQTHFHPEHGFGSQRLSDRTTLIYNRTQYEELLEKGEFLLELFRGFGEHMTEALVEVEFVEPDISYRGSVTLNLGGVSVNLQERGSGHTRGDQTVHLPDSGILFTGDLVEDRFFPIISDADASGVVWIQTLGGMERLRPVTVVPGHGALGGFEVLSSYRSNMKDWFVEARALKSNGLGPDDVVSVLSPKVLGGREDWGNQEWIEPMIRQFYEDERANDFDSA
jgi:glyoxylase-like metal-dependent hydrolase (beta-lactamase superfamily II)